MQISDAEAPACSAQPVVACTDSAWPAVVRTDSGPVVPVRMVVVALDAVAVPAAPVHMVVAALGVVAVQVAAVLDVAVVPVVVEEPVYMEMFVVDSEPVYMHPSS